MPPQPLSRVVPNATIVISEAGRYPLEERPKLLAPAMRVISAWSTLDAQISHTFVAMLGSKPYPAINMYQSLSSTAAQKDALRAVAKEQLNTDQAPVFEVLLSLHSAAAKGRNRVAHWVWGTAPELPDAALLCDPTGLTKFALWTEYHAHLRLLESYGERTGIAEAEKPRIEADTVYVYRARDFLELTKSIERLSGLFQQFMRALSPHHNKTQAVQLIQTLSDEPEIRQKLDRLLRDRRTSPEE